MRQGVALSRGGRPAEAEPLLQQGHEMYRGLYPAESWWIPYTMGLWGMSILRQGRYEEAEPLLVDAYESMNPPPVAAPRKPQALLHIVELYEAWGKPEKAAQWQAKLDPQANVHRRSMPSRELSKDP